MLYKRIWQGKCNLRVSTVFQKYSTLQNVELDAVENKSKEKKPKKKRSYIDGPASSEVISHLKESNQEHYVNFIPKSVLKKTNKKKSSLYIINQDTAKQFCSLIADDLLKNTSYVIENNPGLGFLTENLLKIGVPTINLYEKNHSFLLSGSPLLNLITKYKNRLHTKNLSFTDMWLLALRDGYHCENLSGSYLDDAPYFDWVGNSYAQIIMFLPERTSLSMIIHNFFNHSSLFAHGRPTFYIAVPSEVWNKFNTLNDDQKRRRFYLHYNVMFNLFFDCHYFGELPRKSFLPWPMAKAKAKVDALTIPMSVIKIEPKKDAFKVLKKENIGPFWFFLKHCMRSAKVRVIEQIESFESGIGVNLIKKNIDITTTFKELPPQKLLEIFKIYRASPGYDESMFMPDLKFKIEEKEVEKAEVEKDGEKSEPEHDTSS